MSDQSTPAPEQRLTPASIGDLVRSLDWRLELLGVFLVLAESALIYLVTGLFLSDRSPAAHVLPAWIVAFVMLTAYLVPRVLDEWRVWDVRYETMMGGAIVVTLLVSVKSGAFPGIAVWDIGWLREMIRALALLDNDAVRPVWGIVALVAFAWWRGRTRELPSVDSAYLTLRAGSAILALLMIVILLASDTGDEIHQRLSAATVTFYVCALAAIGIARLKLEGFRTSSPLGPRWLATFVAPILTILAVAIVGAGIFSRQFLDTVLWMLSPLLFILNLVFQAIILIMAALAYIILTPIVWLIGTRDPISRTVATPGLTDQRGELDQLGGRAFQVPDPIRYLVAALVLLALFTLLTKFVFRRRRRERVAVEEERESILDWDDLLGSLGARLRSLFRRDSEEPADPLAHLRGDPRWQYTVAIREAWRRLEHRGAALGRRRRPAETADEYRPGISARLDPGPTSDAVTTMTDRYRDARYSGEPASKEDADQAERAWRTIDQLNQRHQ